ncbi:hypothetical protein [Rhodococcus tibetensis]|uniref:Tail assembly chaperone n=1 Tax=Rhodococcus tibetensis TaxID=2965064 RepID=A0ABT1QCE8_9NOCA|nr:hypothetical protein [Rhodococcus sp. FXJ9.536]MCQ4119887.1 hypothetical protein [Rhodococcus sp. FXJ9.536]
MPANDDFDAFENDEEFSPEELRAAAAALREGREADPELDDDEDPAEDDEADEPDEVDEVDETRTAAAAVVRANRPNRKQRRAAGSIPSHAPKPQDRKPKKSPAQAEAEDSDLLLTLFGEELRIDRSAVLNNWDWQLGAIEKNPLQMVKGLLGQKQFNWFCMRSQAEGMQPLQAATELMDLFATAAGFESAGNS